MIIIVLVDNSLDVKYGEKTSDLAAPTGFEPVLHE